VRWKALDPEADRGQQLERRPLGPAEEMDACVLVAEAQHIPAVGARDRRLAELARLERVQVRVRGDGLDEALLRLPQVVAEQTHVARLLRPEAPEREEGEEGLRRRRGADAREQLELAGIL